MATHDLLEDTRLSNEVGREMGSLHPLTLVVIRLPRRALQQCDVPLRLTNLRYCMSERPSSKPEQIGKHRYDIIAPTIAKSQLCTPPNVSDSLELCHAVGLMNGVDRRRRKPVRRSQATV